jgi:short subunit dehydrogenase-like uncharacterized protein
MGARDFDLVIYGATGFVGKQTVEYISTHAPSCFRWAIVGRDQQAVEAIGARLHGPARPAEVLVADSRDPVSVDAVVRRTGVLLNTAGPFALYGTPVVDACVRFRTHYVDITGEVKWVRELITTYHDRAADEGTRIVTCCGFDSVPSDIGALIVAREVARVFATPCVAVRACFQLYGGFNGGTVASAMNEIGSQHVGVGNEPFLLDPPNSTHTTNQTEKSEDLRWPRYDPDLNAWVAPFFMAPTNTRVVRRSAALQANWGEPYGDEFVYQEALKFDPPWAAAKASVFTVGYAAFEGLLRWSPTRRLMTSVLPKPGEGPSQETMNTGWFTYELLGNARDGRQLRGMIREKGDPGNRATTKFVCESALCLLDTQVLPGGPARGGVLTPATGLGHVLVDRLRAAGVAIELEQIADVRGGSPDG